MNGMTPKEEEKVLKTYSNLEKINDQKYVITCPYDRKEFTGESIEEVIHEEGVYRSKNWVDLDKHVVHASQLESNLHIVKDWKKEEQSIGGLSPSEVECVTRIIKKTCEDLDKVESNIVSGNENERGEKRLSFS